MSEDMTLQTQLLRQMGTACLTLADLASGTGHGHGSISAAMSKLVSRGLVCRVEVGCFQLTEDGQAVLVSGLTIKSGPRRAHTGRRSALRDTLRQRAWNAMRVAGRFTIRDIAMASSRGAEIDAVENISRFFRELSRAGYLRKIGREPGTAPGSNGFLRFVLVKNTGPKVPVYSAKKRAILDYNTGEDVPCS